MFMTFAGAPEQGVGEGGTDPSALTVRGGVKGAIFSWYQKYQIQCEGALVHGPYSRAPVIMN